MSNLHDVHATKGVVIVMPAWAARKAISKFAEI